MGWLTGVLSALIAALVSIAVALISYFSNRNELKLQREQLEREQQRSMTTKLYDKRLEVYPEAIQITDGLRKSKLAAQGQDISEDYFSTILEKLDEWHSKKAFLLLSERAVHSFYALRWVLREKPETATGYSQEHLGRIQQAKGKFRYALRLDIQLLYAEEAYEASIDEDSD